MAIPSPANEAFVAIVNEALRIFDGGEQTPPVVFIRDDDGKVRAVDVTSRNPFKIRELPKEEVAEALSTAKIGPVGALFFKNERLDGDPRARWVLIDEGGAYREVRFGTGVRALQAPYNPI